MSTLQDLARVVQACKGRCVVKDHCFRVAKRLNYPRINWHFAVEVHRERMAQPKPSPLHPWTESHNWHMPVRTACSVYANECNKVRNDVNGIRTDILQQLITAAPLKRLSLSLSPFFISGFVSVDKVAVRTAVWKANEWVCLWGWVLIHKQLTMLGPYGPRTSRM
jgi:hypothetical protein